MFGLIFRVGILISLPFFSLVRRANAGVLLDSAVENYSVELIVVLCFLMMIVGCLASILTEEPLGVAPTKVSSKIVFALFGSLCAFMYIAQYEEKLSMVHAAWIGGVAFASPAVIPSCKALVYELIPVAKERIKILIARIFGSNDP